MLGLVEHEKSFITSGPSVLVARDVLYFLISVLMTLIIFIKQN